MRWVAVFLYGAATGGGVLIAGTRGLGVGWDQAYGPSPSAVSGLFWGLMVAGLVVPVWAVRAIVTRSPGEWPQMLVPAVLIRRVKPGDECVALLCAPGAAGYVAYGTAPSGLSLRPSSAAELVRLPRITLQGVEPD
jgi:hypothetical protein